MPKLYFAIAILTISFSSCKKEVDNASNRLITNNSVNALVKPNLCGSWYATYGIFDPNYGYIPQDTLQEDSLIHKGYISLPYQDPSHSSTINYDIPQNNYLDGDSTTFRFVIRDSSNDQIINIVGSLGFVSIEHFGETWGLYTADFGRSEYVGYQPFTSFTTVLIIFKGNKVIVYTDDKIVLQYNYNMINNREPLLGKLQSISLEYSTYLQCDEVTLYNSFTRKLLMKEKFNLEGKSNTVFY